MHHPCTVLTLFVLFFASLSCTPLSDIDTRKRPYTVDQGQIAGQVQTLQAGTTFSYSGLGFLNGKLYAGTNIGVLEINEEGSSRLFKWLVSDDVVSEPWIYKGNSSIWFFHSGLQKVVRLNEGQWSEVALPTDIQFNRADMLNGLRGLNSASGLWFQSTRAVWRWGDQGKWDRLKVPEFDCSFNILDPSEERVNSGCFASILPLENSTFILTHSRYLPSAWKPEGAPIQPDRLYRADSNGDLQRVFPTSSSSFIIDERRLVLSRTAVYAPSRMDGMIVITAAGVSQIKTPGEIGSLTVSSDGDPVAHFPGLGIFKWKGEWEKLFSEPAKLSTEDYDFFVAKDDQRVAFAATPKRPDQNANRSYLWLSSGNQLVEHQPY